jgi:hypothetical protein
VGRIGVGGERLRVDVLVGEGGTDDERVPNDVPLALGTEEVQGEGGKARPSLNDRRSVDVLVEGANSAPRPRQDDSSRVIDRAHHVCRLVIYQT